MSALINLLPPKIKAELEFARWNAITVHYLKIVACLIVLLGSSFAGTYIFLQNQVSSLNNQLSQKQSQVEAYKPIIGRAKALNDRVAAIKAIQQSQPKFSSLLDDISKFSLKGTAITSINLTGDDTKPVQITATADSYNAAVSLRDALASSPRVSGADIQTISDTGNGYRADIIIGFKPGKAR